MVNAVAYSEQQLSLFDECEYSVVGGILGSSFGRTSQVLFHPTRAWTFEPCLRKSDRPKFQYLQMADGQTQDWQNCLSVKLHGASSILNIGECPDAAAESSLSRILQPMTDVPEKYYLSPRACAGILRRAKKRGKKIPEELRIALERQVML